MKKTAVLFFILFLWACSGSRTFIDADHQNFRQIPPPAEDEVLFQLFMIGDAGAPQLSGDPVLSLFNTFLEAAPEQSAAVFLGDNIYLNGLPDSTHPQRSYYEQRIDAQLDAVEDFKGRVIFVPGNHDWDNGGPDGLEAIKRQEDYIENRLDRGNTFLPDNGFPGPVEVKLMDKDNHPALKRDIRMVLLDTQWWLHPFEKPYGDNGDFEVQDGGDVINELQDIMRDRKNDYVIVAGHHPLVSNDNHGGYFPLKTHLLPPVFGSLYVMYRKVFGYHQDVSNHRYKEMKNAIESTLAQKEEVIYIAGHAHTLQYHKLHVGKRQTIHHIISGAGSKTDYVAKGRGAEFAHGGSGFSILKFYEDGSAWLEAWEPSPQNEDGNLLYRTQVMEPSDALFSDDEIQPENIDYADSTVVVAPNAEYDRGGFLYRGLMGSNRRDMWSVESEYPVFDITEVEGGLHAVRMGGKGQSNTLHLESEDGREFVLRSVDKQAGKVWDDALKQSFALEVAQDRFSMLNPYAALIVARLAEPAGVNYVQPKYYVVPDDPLLGEYGDMMAGKLALFEQKPDNDMSDVASVGFAEEVVSHMDLMREIDGDVDHRVDQKLFARSRLFDLLIGDWDRHYDQWRWAELEPEDGQGKIYEPIPRDRDVAFMKLNGIAPTLAKLGPFFQYQNFEKYYGNLKGLSYNSLGLTRRFTNQLSRQDWLDISHEMENQLTDERIDSAVLAYPPEAYELYGAQTAKVLKARRDQLVRVANEYADLLMGTISITGSHKREKFFIEFLTENRVRVRMNKLSGKGNLREQYYKREFDPKETSEIRIYALGGDDEFELSGTSSSSIKVRIIGGSGKDVIRDEHPSTKRNIEVYDTNNGIVTDGTVRARFHFSEHPSINHYNYKTEYSWNSTIVGFFFAFSDDDGIFIGGGPRITKYSFRKHPAQSHYIRANYAALTGAANFRYSGDWYQTVGNWDAGMNAKALLPKSYRYYFGLGNETPLESRFSSNYYRAQLQQYGISGEVHQTFADVMNLRFGGGIQVTQVNDVAGANILTNPQLGVNPNVFSNQWYGSVTTGLTINDLDNTSNPKYGALLRFTSKTNMGLNSQSKSHVILQGESKVFYTFQTQKQITLAGRIGTSRIFGSFPFYEANTIGGRNAVRGYNSSRFSGRSTLFSNAEIRAELFHFYRYLLGGKTGLLAFYDTGRVWADGEASSLWHQGYGGGIWFNLFDQFLISGNMGFSGEDTSFELKAGFFF